MAEQRHIAVNRMEGAAVPRLATAAPAVLTPKDICSILRRHILLIITLTISGFIIGGVAWYLLLQFFPKYTAQTLIRVLPAIEKDPWIIGTGLPNKDVQYGYRLSIANLINQQRTLQELLKKDKIRETKWFRRFAEFDENNDIKNVDRCILKAFRDLKKRFSAYAHRDAEFVVLSMTCHNAEEAADIVNEMATLFLESQGATKQGEITAKLTELEARRNSVQLELTAAEQALAEVRTRFEITDLERPAGRYFQHTITLKLNQLELARNDMILLIKQAEADIENLKRLAVGPFNEQVERQVESDPVMIMLAQQLAILESELAGQLTRFGETHTVVRRAQERINETKYERQIRQSEIAEQVRQANLKNAQDRLIVLKDRLEELERLRLEAEAKKEDLDLARVQYEQRVAIREERKYTLDEIKAQIEKYRIMHDDPETPKVQSVGPAQKPLEVSSPRWEFYFPGGTILGFIFGIGLALALELLNDLVRTPRDVARFLNIPLLSVIPDREEDEQVRDIDLCHVVRQAPYSIISESYRRCRTSIELSGSESPMRALLVSSGAAGDGKTSVAVNLSATFVTGNKKVLLIDANFRRPSLQTIFPKPVEQSKLGLSSLLLGQCGYQEAIRPSGIDDLDIIDSGPMPANPAELLGTLRMEELIKEQRKNYDYIIVDGPPVLLVSDAKILAKIVDATVLVFNASATRRGAAQRTILELKTVNAKIVGCVLFAVKVLKGGYFQEQFRSYQEYQKLQLAHSI
jgi:succinoglycan biosynthesis transport protein ExoP